MKTYSAKPSDVTRKWYIVFYKHGNSRTISEYSEDSEVSSRGWVLQ